MDYQDLIALKSQSQLACLYTKIPFTHKNNCPNHKVIKIMEDDWHAVDLLQIPHLRSFALERPAFNVPSTAGEGEEQATASNRKSIIHRAIWRRKFPAAAAAALEKQQLKEISPVSTAALDSSSNNGGKQKSITGALGGDEGRNSPVKAAAMEGMTPQQIQDKIEELKKRKRELFNLFKQLINDGEQKQSARPSPVTVAVVDAVPMVVDPPVAATSTSTASKSPTKKPLNAPVASSLAPLTSPRMSIAAYKKSQATVREQPPPTSSSPPATHRPSPVVPVISVVSPGMSSSKRPPFVDDQPVRSTSTLPYRRPSPYDRPMEPPPTATSQTSAFRRPSPMYDRPVEVETTPRSTYDSHRVAPVVENDPDRYTINTSSSTSTERYRPPPISDTYNAAPNDRTPYERPRYGAGGVGPSPRERGPRPSTFYDRSQRPPRPPYNQTPYRGRGSSERYHDRGGGRHYGRGGRGGGFRPSQQHLQSSGPPHRDMYPRGEDAPTWELTPRPNNYVRNYTRPSKANQQQQDQ
eukprot:Partr_v1_DN29031_c0_g1_i1_m58901